MYLAIDPGKGATDSIGVAEFGLNGNFSTSSQLTFDQLIGFLEATYAVDTVVIEEYKIFRGMAKQHTGSSVETAQTIGAIRAWAVRNNVEVVLQPSNILPIAQKLFQTKMPKNHAQSHQVSAYLHGAYWLYKKGVIKSELEKQQEK